MIQAAASPDRWARALILLAALVAAVQGLCHAVLLAGGGYPAAADPVIAAMTDTAFSYGGREMTFWRLHFGYGLLSALTSLAFAAIILTLAFAPRESATLVRRVAFVIIGILLAHAAFTAWWFFSVPAGFDLVAASLLGAASLRMRRPE